MYQSRALLRAGVDPKSIVCEHFRAGQCSKGFKCKYSHDLNVERKGGKAGIYGDEEDKTVRPQPTPLTVSSTLCYVAKCAGAIALCAPVREQSTSAMQYAGTYRIPQWICYHVAPKHATLGINQPLGIEYRELRLILESVSQQSCWALSFKGRYQYWHPSFEMIIWLKLCRVNNCQNLLYL